ncbi:NUDIX domain protein [Talaromyces stipitatus ATCC 10500]|uniref:NUDIX domain protein n=1 Tax=Talaromyces stipitatus (strain ATCC 10500 / CBS 375.48 / QM 6759 / NRRL 1006) TaxID=441959 RepID=B8MEQ5_TALSN|nr:NUDIX domain protein [Talaromyces stipitatus ATCC 10500]EED16938.1 NUDIX domain protein [Talaromyces stipitatus ATCC 10500]
MATNMAGSPLYSYTVAPHLAAEFDVPFADFALAHPQYKFFVVAGFVFTKRSHSQPLPASASEYVKIKHLSSSATTSKSERGQNEPLMLIIQRALDDSYGGYWDFPGGSLEPHDQTILDGVAREVLEETGLHVSKIRDIVRIDTWIGSKSQMLVAGKFSFVVDVHEAADTVGWEEKIKLAPEEHVRWLWVSEEEIEKSAVRPGEDRIVPYAFVGVQGETAWEAFKTCPA